MAKIFGRCTVSVLISDHEFFIEGLMVFCLKIILRKRYEK